MINLLCRSVKPTALSSLFNPLHGLTSRTSYGFSQFFDQKDKQQLFAYNTSKSHNKFYRDIISQWKNPLERKRLRRERLLPIKESRTRPEEEDAKLVVHNPAVGISYPPEIDQIFCVIKVDGRQYKVSNDCVVLLDTKHDFQINKKIFFEVLLVGTRTYTLIGRPVVQNATVQAMVESITRSHKVIVFKKKRRKGYKRSFGSRNKITTCRILNISHVLSEAIMSQAVSVN